MEPREAIMLTLSHPSGNGAVTYLKGESSVKTIFITSLKVGLIEFVLELTGDEKTTVTFCGGYIINWKP